MLNAQHEVVIIHNILDSDAVIDDNSPMLTHKQSKGQELVHTASAMRKRSLNEKLAPAKRIFAQRVLTVMQEDAANPIEKAQIRAYAEFIYRRGALEGLETADMIGLSLLLPRNERAEIYAAATRSHSAN